MGGDIGKLVNFESGEGPAVSGMKAGPNDGLDVGVCNDFFDM